MTHHSLYPKVLVFIQFTIIGAIVLFSTGFCSSILPVVIFMIGLLCGLLAIKHNKLGNFNIQPKLKESSQLITSGIYQYIRHPMYTSVSIMMFAFFISTPSSIEGFLFVILITVLTLKAKKEEELWLIHDKSYQEYKKRTKLFIPYLL